MNNTPNELQLDLELPDCPQPRTDDYDEFIRRSPLTSILSCTRATIGAFDDYDVRVLVNEDEEYASVHVRVPEALPADVRAELLTLSVHRIEYTDRDRAWDAVGGGCTSDRERWSAWVDTVLYAMSYARAAVETAVWAHARGEQWVWPYPPPSRQEEKYEFWGDDHPATYDPYLHYPERQEAIEDSQAICDDVVQF